MARPARPASTICVFRDGAEGAEVLMVRRGATARFMGGAWVFPGGTVDEIDRSATALDLAAGDVRPEPAQWMLAAVRELVEETQVWITDPPVGLAALEPFLKDDEVYAEAARRGCRFDLDRLGYFANWITPSMVPMRFDTRFYAAAVPADTAIYPDPAELDRGEWVRPEVALERARSGDWVVPFPTRKTLELFVGFGSATAVMDHVRALGEIPPVQPRMRVGPHGGLEIVLPGEPGFDELSDDGPEPEVLQQAARAAAAAGEHLPEIDVPGDVDEG